MKAVVSMTQSRLIELLGTEYPVLQGGMLWVAGARLAAAVSDAGALGILGAYAGMEEGDDVVGNLESQIDHVRVLTKRPIGVNLPLDISAGGLLVDVLLKKGVEVVVTAAGSPGLYTELFHAAGMKVLHVVASAKQAVFAESCGVDGVIAEGSEAAARLGYDETPLFSLIPLVRDAVSVPVIAAGGIADGRGMAAAFALGAEGVQLGTRFVATDECIAHQAYKDALVEAGDTIVTCRKLIPTRSLLTEFTRTLWEAERDGATGDKLREIRGRTGARKAQLEGDLDHGEAYAGASVGLIGDIVPARAAVERLIAEYEEVIKGLRT